MDRRRLALILSVAGLLLLLAALGVLICAWRSEIATDERRLVVIVCVFAAIIGFLLEGFSRVCLAMRDLEQRVALLERERSPPG